MDTQVEVCCQFREKAEIRDVLERLKKKLLNAVTVIASCRESQARRRIQLYYDNRLIDEFKKAGKRIARKT